MPSDKTMEHIAQILRDHPAKHLIWETRPRRDIADRLEQQFGLQSVEFSPCESLGEKQLSQGQDYMSVMRQNLANIRVVFSD